MQRKEIQADIDKEKVILQEISDNLKADYSIEADAIPSRVESLLDKKTELVKEKQTQIEYTNKCEQVKDVVIQEYKYTKALSDSQDKDFREISIRHEARANLPDHAERNFKIGREDRVEILERMEQQHPNNATKCRELFERQAQQEQQKAIEKTAKSMSRNFEMER